MTDLPEPVDSNSPDPNEPVGEQQSPAVDSPNPADIEPDASAALELAYSIDDGDGMPIIPPKTETVAEPVDDVIVAESSPDRRDPNSPFAENSGVAEVFLNDDEPLMLDLVPNAPNPLRFGLRAIFVLTGMFAVQFAIISYAGTLFGLLIGIGVCAVLLAGLILVAMIFHQQHREAWMESLDVLAIRVSVATVLLFIFVILAGGGFLVFDRYARYQQAVAFQSEIGFQGATVWAKKNNKDLQVIRIDAIDPGGAADKAGMKAKDVIISDLSPDEFYDMLQENRGNSISVGVANDPDLMFLEDGSLRYVQLKVPAGG